MSITVIIFGRLAILTGKDKLTLTNLKDTDELQQDLLNRYPALTDMAYLIAVNRKIIRKNTILEPGAAVALLPPFSGG